MNKQVIHASAHAASVYSMTQARMQESAKGPTIKYVTLQGERGSEKVWQFVTEGRGGGKDCVTSHFQFFHNSEFYVLFYILSYILLI